MIKAAAAGLLLLFVAIIVIIVPPVPVSAQVVQASVIAEKPLGELAVVREYYTSHSLGPESSGVSVLDATCEQPNEVPIAGGFTVTNSSDNNRLRIYGSMPNLTSSAWQVIVESVDDRSTQNVIVGVNVLCLQQQQQQQNNTTTASPVTLEDDDDDEEATITSSADDDTDDDNSGYYDNGNGVDVDDGGGDNSCHPSYPDDCIPPAPPVLTCDDISARNFQVVGSDPHGFDGDNDGIGCESGSGSNAPDDYVDDGGEEDVDYNESNDDDNDNDNDNDNDDGPSSSSGGSTTPTTTDDDDDEETAEDEEPETPQGDEVDEGPIENNDDSAGDGGNNNNGTSSDS
jgi:hypothetical protein